LNSFHSRAFGSGSSSFREDQYAFYGLRRIGTDKALEAMIPITKSWHDKTIAADAKEYLRQNMHKIQDPDIRKKIETVVQ
jgi:hypothetical protein